MICYYWTNISSMIGVIQNSITCICIFIVFYIKTSRLDVFSLSIMCSSRGLMRNHSRGLMRNHVEITWSIIFELKYSRINDKIILLVLKHIHLSLSWTMVTLFLHSFSITTGQQQNIVKRFIFKMIQFWSSVNSGLLIAEIFVYRRVFFLFTRSF